MVWFYRIAVFAFLIVTLLEGPCSDAKLRVSLPRLELSGIEVSLMVEKYKLRDVTQVNLVSRTLVKEEERFNTYVVVLKHPQLNKIQLKVREPKAGGRYPILFMSTGLQTGMNAIDLIHFEEPVIVAAFDYPMKTSGSAVEIVSSLLSSLLTMHGQLVVAFKWLSQQPNVRADRFNVLNVSLGSFVVPLAQRIASAAGLQFYSTIFAFGGADPATVILPEVERIVGDGPLNTTEYNQVVTALSTASDFLDSRRHLPYLSGRFLVIEGLQDTIVPHASTQALYEGLPHPKTLIQLDVPHINDDRPDIILKTSQVIKTWLKENAVFDLQ